MATTDTQPTSGPGKPSALDASLRLVGELAEAMNGQVQRAVRQIDDTEAVSLPPRIVNALRYEARELERECGRLRERFALEGIEQPGPAVSPPPPAERSLRADTRADAARTLALELRALGIERDEVASRLVNTFEVDDAERVVDSVFIER